MQTSDLILDYSAHSAWDYCPANWYEKYVNRRRKHWPPGQQDNALVLGSLVHAGMEVWQQTHEVGIPQAVVDECNPTQSCYQLAQELIYGYTRTYPEEKWPLVVCEEPVTFPLLSESCWCAECGMWTYGPDWKLNSGYPLPLCKYCRHLVKQLGPKCTGLAKIDTYFYVPEVTTIPGGLGGQELTLTPGWWIHEYKTKSPAIAIGLYQQSWETGLQASYQLIALQKKVDKLKGYEHKQVQGILVNVMEKPKRHIPKRKCKGCKELLEFALYIPTGRGTYQCHMCGEEQSLTPLKTETHETPPAYYRVLVTRSQDQLDRDMKLIRQTARRMMRMRDEGLDSVPWTKANCVSFQYRKACDYFQPHLSGEDTRELTSIYEEPPDYRGLIQISGEPSEGGAS